VRALLAQLRVELTLSLRRGESLLVQIVIPLLLLVFVAISGFGSPQYIVPGLLALAVMSTSMVSLGIGTAYERYYGALKRLLGAPLPRLSLVTAKTIAVLITEMVQIVLLVIASRFALGWTPGGSPALALLALVIGSFAFAGLGLLLAGTLRAEMTLVLTNLLYLVFLLLGGFVVPLDQLAGPIGAVVHVLPAAALADATRAALTDPVQGVVGPLALLAGWAVLGMGAAALTFRAD
jgi:ABC-2 type transport system permease protein